MGDGNGNRKKASLKGAKLNEQNQNPGAERSIPAEPVAIIGIGCRFPGADGPEAFWQLLIDGRNSIRQIPADRFDIDAVYDARPGIPGKLNTRYGGFLDRVDEFDPYFFGISPREASAMDPQQRILLEVAWEAMEDAGQTAEKIDPGRTGVFVGMCNSDYAHLLQDPADIDIYIAGGIANSILSGRLSYALGLEGPSLTLDTACSTSLVAVHLACQSLASGESTLALAGGVNVILLPHPYIGFCSANMLAKDGQCKFGDASADGFVRSEGAGIVVLKRLSDALADRDPIYAVIRGSAVSNDGRSGGLLMTPSVPGQQQAFRNAYLKAGVSPGAVHYVECHGTGTNVGDPVELQALGSVLAEGRAKDRPCLIGSVKTNIGHTEAAAGVAGLIKTALALKYKIIPPSLHLEDPNPNIPWNNLPLTIPMEATPWPEDKGPALAGVSSFGISGTNAHVVLQESPQAAPGREVTAAPAGRAYLLPMSARRPEALKALAHSYQEFLSAGGEDGSAALHDICYTASLRRTHHDHRLSLVGNSKEGLARQLENYVANGEISPNMASGRRIRDRQPKIAFVFSGQGSQWIGMGRELLEQEPVYRQTLERCDQAMRKFVDWSLLEELAADEEHSHLDQVDVIQPAIFAVQAALAELWRSWGIEPDAVIGQSLGEVAAAYVAGAISLEDAARVICRRSQVVKETSGQGGMAVVSLPFEEAQSACAGSGLDVSVAVSMSPTSTVLSGEANALRALVEELEGRGIHCRWIKVDYASHSPQVEPLVPEMLRILQEVQPLSPSVPIYSTVTGEKSDGMAFDSEYWARNLREPVLFSAALQRLIEDGHEIFIEVSPHPLLLSPIRQWLQELDQEGVTLPSLRTDEGRAVMLGSLGVLQCNGVPIDWNKIYPTAGQPVRLPRYPWQRERFWLDLSGGDSHRPAARGNGKGHLLGQYLKSATSSGVHFWEMDLDARLFRYMADHRVQGLIVLPAAAYVEMALAAATEAFGAGTFVLENMEFKRALFIPENGRQRVQLSITSQMVGDASFELYSEQAGTAEGQVSWTLHARGTIRLGRASLETAEREAETPEQLRARCTESFAGADFYRIMRERGLEYGPSFQGVEQIWRRDGEALGLLRPPDSVQVEASAYQIHPALLDACFQVLAGTLPGGEEEVVKEGVYLPVGLGKLRLYGTPSGELWVHALFQRDEELDGETLKGDVFLIDAEGQVLLEALGFRIQRVERDLPGAAEQDLDDWLYTVQWELQPDEEKGQEPDRAQDQEQDQEPEQEPDLAPAGEGQRWILFADGSGVSQDLQALLEARGGTCISVSSGEAFAELEPGRFQINPNSPEDYQRLFDRTLGPDQPACRGLIHLWSLDMAAPDEITPDSLQKAHELGSFSVLHMVQALAKAGLKTAPRLWLVTAGSQAVSGADESVSIAQAPVWGVGKVISFEHPELRCKKVDLSADREPEEIRSLFQELWSDSEEDQVALRGGDRYVPRLARYSAEAADNRRPASPEEQAFKLEIPNPGILDGFRLRATSRREPGPGEVEIRVRAVGLNFRDIMIAMDLLPPVFEGSLDVGFECAGTIVAVGEGVEGFQVGDGVVAGAPACFGSYVTTADYMVAKKPEQLSFEEAATIPIAFLTAYYALNYLGRIRKGDRVLIHAATGGVGQAAVQIAQQVGAEIFATAGNPEKREFLRAQGVEHIMDSRSLDFADDVMRITNGEGVDLVLNSLAGEFITRGLSVLRAGGRFLEIGKVDILQNTQLGLQLLDNNIAFFAIDLSKLIIKEPAFIRTLWCEAMSFFTDHTFKALPLKVFPVSEAAEAFRYMAQAKHIGKIVVSLEEDQVLVAPEQRSAAFASDGAYLITGGAGGLGLAAAQWMVARGARHLALMGRSGPSQAAQEAIQEMEKAGAEVRILQADVSQGAQVAGALDEIRKTMPPLRGILHAAGVLDDGILLQQDPERFKRVMAPKIDGAWNLHRLTLNDPLDLFVLFSSGASVLGSPGQGNYVAANAFLDGLAHQRRALGLPAITINWGAWGEVGLAARPDRVKHLTGQGIAAFTPQQGVELLGRILEYDPVQMLAAAMDWSKLTGLYSPPFLSYLAEEAAKEFGPSRKKGDGLTREKLLAVEPAKRRKFVEDFLKEQMARVLRSTPDKIDIHQPLTSLGIDSLMAVELKNRVETDLELAIPVTSLLQGPTLSQLASLLLEQLAPQAAEPAEPGPDGQEDEEELLAKLDELSDEEVDTLLHEMLEEEGNSSDPEAQEAAA